MDTVTCLYCGPYKPPKSVNFTMCPTCRLDPIEVAATERVREYGFEFCYKEEVRNEKRRRGQMGVVDG